MHVVEEARDIARNTDPRQDLLAPRKARVHLQHACSRSSILTMLCAQQCFLSTMLCAQILHACACEPALQNSKIFTKDKLQSPVSGISILACQLASISLGKDQSGYQQILGRTASASQCPQSINKRSFGMSRGSEAALGEGGEKRHRATTDCKA